MESANQDERRKHTRVDFSTRILLTAEGLEIDAQGSSRDLSLKGVFVNTDRKPEKGTRCSLKVFLSGGIQPIELSMKATVARIEKNGVALAFDSMDLDSYTHLKNIVRYNSGDGDTRGV